MMAVCLQFADILVCSKEGFVMRNGYIDMIKFIFAIMIAEFHLNAAWFPNGRIAVEGFFMISSYLMMRYIERDRHPEDSLGVSTVRFVYHKWKGLFPILLPSALIAYVITCIIQQKGLLSSLDQLPLLLFEVVPLRNAGYVGRYVVGISWYLSTMFIALAILYPLCRKFRTGFTLAVCPMLAILFYGLLAHLYGHIGIGADFIENSFINSGVLRAVAASALGILVYEAVSRLSVRKPSTAGRVLFTLAEVAGYAYLFYACLKHPRSGYDFFCVYLLFGLLIIGISGFSFTSYLWNPKWTKWLGLMSTYIVLNHVYWNQFLVRKFGSGYGLKGKAWIYVLLVLASCLVVHVASKLIQLGMKKFSSLKLWESK